VHALGAVGLGGAVDDVGGTRVSVVAAHGVRIAHASCCVAYLGVARVSSANYGCECAVAISVASISSARIAIIANNRDTSAKTSRCIARGRAAQVRRGADYGSEHASSVVVLDSAGIDSAQVAIIARDVAGLAS